MTFLQRISSGAVAVLFALSLAAIPREARGGEPPDILRWHRYVAPIFPPELASTNVSDGFASVAFTFDEDGRLTDRIVTAASHPAFSAAVLEAAREWRIDVEELARHSRRETLRFEFHRTAFIVSLTNRESAKARFTPYIDQGATAFATCTEEQLDRPLKFLDRPAAIYPPELKSGGVRGRATVSFIVDALGRVRVPAVVDASDPAFGDAAVAAVREWTFATSHQLGIPVQVSVERTFVFGANSPAR